MSVSEMKKLTVVALKKDAGKVMRKLMWLESVEIEPAELVLDGETVAVSDNGGLYASERQSALRDAETITAALKLLSAHGGVKRGLFSIPNVVSRRDFENGIANGIEYSELCEIAGEIVRLDRERTEKEADMREAEIMSEAFSPWVACDMRLDGLFTKYTETVLGIAPPELDAQTAETGLYDNGIEAVTEILKKEKSASYVSVTFLKEKKEAALGYLALRGFEVCDFFGACEKPAEEISRLSERIRDIKKEISDIILRIESFADKYTALETALDMARTRARIAGSKQDMLCTERAVAIFGWIPVDRVEKLEKTLSEHDVFYELVSPAPEDDVPVRLVNKRPASCFEGIVTMYSPPAYGAFDPTGIMSVFFFIIFGLMLSDAVYGLILTFGGLFIAKRARLSRSAEDMCRAFSICGISCILWGIAFGSYLGDLPVRFMKSAFGVDIDIPKVMDITEGAIYLLILALALGAVHMMTGMALRFYVLCARGRALDAVLDEGSRFVLFIGIGMYFVYEKAGIVLMTVGALTMIAGGGRREKRFVMRIVKGIGSLYGLVGYASDLLSYSRIMALGLSSAVVASVFNILAVMGGGGVFGALLFIVVLIVGHALNLAINVLGAFVHTSRLQYVEFFGRFFEGGGRAFRPLRPDMTHAALA